MGRVERSGAVVGLIVVLVYMMLCVAPAYAVQGKGVATVHSFGSGTIRGADQSAGRNEAISASLDAAVTQVLMDITLPDLVVGHFQAINDSILSRTDQFILNYKMLTESTHGKEHRVMVRARVSIQRLKKALKDAGIYVGSKSYPSVLVCLAEKQIHQANFQYWWGQQQVWRAGAATGELTQLLEGKGLSMINPTINPSRRGYAPQLSIPEAVALGREARADVVVIGEAMAQESSNATGAALSPFRGSVIVRAIRTDNGEEIGQVQRDAVATDSDPLSGGNAALVKAASLVGDELAAKIISGWFAEGAGGSKLEIMVQGLSGNIASFVKFRGALSTMSGVDNVQRKEMKSDIAVLQIDYQGSARTLADALKRQQFDTFTLDIAEPEDNTIRLQLVPR